MELGKPAKILSKNGYPQKFICKCIFKFLSRIFEYKTCSKGSKEAT